MQALGIEPFGRRRRITMRVTDARAAMIGGGAPPAASAAPATGGMGGVAPPAAAAAPATGGSGGGAPPAAAASPATGGIGGGAPPRPRRPPATGGGAVGPRPPATPPPSDLVAAAGPRPPRMAPPTWATLHEDESGARAKKGKRKRDQGSAQAAAAPGAIRRGLSPTFHEDEDDAHVARGMRSRVQYQAQGAATLVAATSALGATSASAATSASDVEAAVTAGGGGCSPHPIGKRPHAVDPITAAGPRPPSTPPPQSVLDAAAGSADQPRAGDVALGARSKKKAAPKLRRKRGCRGGRKRKMPIDVTDATSEVSSDEGIDAVGRSA